MYVRKSAITIEIDNNEAFTLAVALEHEILKACEHYRSVTKPEENSVFVMTRMECERLPLMKLFYALAGRPDRYDVAQEAFERVLMTPRKEQEA